MPSIRRNKYQFGILTNRSILWHRWLTQFLLFFFFFLLTTFLISFQRITFKVMLTALQLYSNYSCSESVLVEQNKIGWPCKRVLPQVISVPIVHADACISVEVEREIRVQAFRAFLSESNLDIAIVQDMQDIYWLSGFNTPGRLADKLLLCPKTNCLFCHEDSK